MQIDFPEFERLIKALGRMSGPPTDAVSDHPELANVLFCARVGHEGAWAFYANGFEILGLRVRANAPLVGRLLYPRAELIAIHRAMASAGPQAGDAVLFAEEAVTLRRAEPSRARGHLKIAASDGLYASLRNLPEATGPRSVLSPTSLGVIQRAADFWDDSGDCLWLNATEGVFAHARGLYRHSPCVMGLPEPRIGFSDFLGVLGLDPSTSCDCYLASFPGLEQQGSQWVGFEQPEAIYFSAKFSAEELEGFKPAAREALLGRIMASPKPWLQVPRRPERREIIRLLTEMGGEGVLLTSDAKGVVRATNGRSKPIRLAKAQSERPGSMACRTADLCRILRQDFGCLDMPGDKELAGITFRRSEGEECGAITAASRP